MKIKIYELAKKLGIDNKQVVEMAQKNNIDVKSHLSSITEEEEKMLEKLLRGVFKKKSMENKQEKNDEPVIIRRAVIFSDDDKKEEEKEKEKAKRENSFDVEKNRKKDYNIVYRNKPSKPLTVSELFGISKNEPKEEKVKEENAVKNEELEKTSKEEKLVESEEVKEVPKGQINSDDSGDTVATSKVKNVNNKNKFQTHTTA